MNVELYESFWGITERVGEIGDFYVKIINKERILSSYFTKVYVNKILLFDYMETWSITSE